MTLQELIVQHIIAKREELINELDERIKVDGASPHVIREVVVRKFNEL